MGYPHEVVGGGGTVDRAAAACFAAGLAARPTGPVLWCVIPADRFAPGPDHWTGKPVGKTINELADQWAFAARWTGLEAG